MNHQEGGFYGRTYTGKPIDMKVSRDGLYLEQVEADLVMIGTKNANLSCRAVVELTLIESGERSTLKKRMGLGFSLIPFF